MGRVLKRVPLKFDWPLNKVWTGYVNPHHKPCPDPGCHNGLTPAGRYLEALVQLIMIAGENGMSGKKHPWLHTGLVPDGPPSRDMAELTEGLAERKMAGPFGHDALDNWRAVKKIKKAAGVGEDWGLCPTCKGNAIDPTVQKAYDKWKPEEPPKGKGYQLWETTSEGSPQSPVFATLDELCGWAAENATTFASYKASKEKWREMLDEGFVCHQEGRNVFM